MAVGDKTLLDWSKELDELIREGIVAVQSRNIDAMVGAQGKLEQFVQRSPDYADALDQQANLAIVDIDIENTAQAVAGLKSRREEIARIAKSLDGITTELAKDAATLRLERAKAAVDAATKTIAALKEVRDTLKASGSEKALGDSILTAIGAIQDIRSKVEAA
jgi:ABC-type transporter Mla subunit MlaD